MTLGTIAENLDVNRQVFAIVSAGHIALRPTMTAPI